ncbi:Glycosyl transferase family 2 [Geodermatophilus dictyosporus]|uniref:4,4'-diaponeurosporenoate glycosyltransferase n=1 Tax=Geodermatophilus dictyosporus TaxID=1523247 RepID=A0A1I5MU79_9ACTN|nr:glycosyltransferase [Geodermatophilus dictyosporus]SFP13124.1 Glycosyl transferase family 2 [Geodermatophilus dictyosporus]
MSDALREQRPASQQFLDVSVVVPVRNAESLIEDCLASIRRANPREIIVVDGLSSDRTVEIARRHGATVLSDEGRGLPVARRMGAEAASSRLVALVDVDVRLGEGDLERLLTEFREEGYTALQAGLHSVSGSGYWGRALANHHRTGRSKNWFGVVATVFDRDTLLTHGFDDRFLSGEDVDLRWRLQRAGARIGVSRRTVVEHRFEDSWDFAKGQFVADGHGLGRMVVNHGVRAAVLLGLPAAAAVRGIVLSLVRLSPQWIPYYLVFAVYNYLAMGRELLGHLGRARRRPSPGASA